ncbi:MAG: lysylphosphatidylglycerol synthase transmembrane domain-containing protein [Ignavibacteriaceae bacterium]
MILGKKNISHSVKRAVNISLSFLLTILFLYIAFQGVDFFDVLNHIGKASIFWIFIFISVQMISHYLRAVRWKIIMQSAKPDIPVKHLFGALMVGYGVNCVVPRLGEVTRAVLAGRWAGVSRSSLFGTVIVERVIDIIFLGFTVIVSVLMWSENLYVSFPWLESTLYVTMLLMGGIIFFLYMVIKFKEKFYTLITKLLQKFSNTAADKVLHVFEMLTEGFTSLKGAKNYVYTILFSAVIMILYAFSSYIGFFTIGMEQIQPVTFAMGWVLMSISSIGVVIPTPGGTGSYHALTSSALVLLFGFSKEISLAYAVLTHGISYFLFIIAALLIFFIFNKRHENLIKVVETEIKEL